jgi:hypothetical protein
MWLGLYLVAGLLASGVRPGSAQIVQGQLLDAETGAPVDGALILLLSAAGEEAGGYLTNPAGRFMISAPTVGTYTVRAERIGYETVISDAFLLRQSERFGLRLEARKTAIELEEIRVEGDRRCLVRPGEGLQVASVWEEARKALTVQNWTEREGSFQFEMARYERELDESERIVRSETRRVESGVSRSPIRSRPAEDLLTEGFVRPAEDGGYDYFGPDASVLLSDLFLDTHCFNLDLDPERADEVGLSFEPVSRGRIPDIAGTLWLDSETARLKSLEYTYTWAPWEEAYGVAQGQVDFENLPTGAWIVRKWWIQMPVMGADFTVPGSRATSRVRVVGIKEVGGEILRYSSLDRTVVSEELPKGALGGLVWDGTRQLPLAGATVFLSGTSYASETDPEGNFLISNLPEGVFKAVFTHPRLDSLGAYSRAVQVTITPGVSTNVTLGIPSTGTDLALSCNVDELEEGTSAVIGFIRGAGTEEPVEGATVIVTWSSFEGLSVENLVERKREFQTTTDSTGHYTACGVPVDTRLTVRAVIGERETETLQITAEEGRPAVANLFIGG